MANMEDDTSFFEKERDRLTAEISSVSCVRLPID